MKDWKYFNKTHQAKTGKSETKHYYYDVSETVEEEKLKKMQNIKLWCLYRKREVRKE